MTTASVLNVRLKLRASLCPLETTLVGTC